jgi:plastocyanin domain-containing protein
MRPEETHTKLFKFFILSLIFASVSFAQDTGKKIYRATVDADGIQRISVLGGEYFYDPDYIIVKVNVPVELKIRKEPSIVPHNIIAKESDAGIDFKESIGTDPKVIKFTPKKIGKYPFYCDKRLLFLKGHRERGMEGILEVTE